MFGWLRRLGRRPEPLRKSDAVEIGEDAWLVRASATTKRLSIHFNGELLTTRFSTPVQQHLTASAIVDGPGWVQAAAERTVPSIQAISADEGLTILGGAAPAQGRVAEDSGRSRTALREWDSVFAQRASAREVAQRALLDAKGAGVLGAEEALHALA